MSILKDAKHWRDRAAEARNIAKKAADRTVREGMNKIADEYEKIASKADQCEQLPNV